MKKRGSLMFLTKEGIKNVWMNRLMSIASICVLLSCLVMIGAAFMIFVNMNAAMEGIEDQNVVMVFIEDKTGEEAIQKVGMDLQAIDNVKECVFVPKEEAFAEQLENLGSESALFEGIENPLPDAYKVTLADLGQFDLTVAQIKGVEHVLRVRENRELATQLMSVRKTVTYISFGVIAVLLVVSLFIISNTVRITMFSRRLEIKIMKSVGATSWFIRWPFMVEGMMLGMISGLAALGIVGGVYYIVRRSVGSVASILLENGLVPFRPYVLYLLIGFLAIGIIAGAFGSAVTIRKYLKEQEYEEDEI